MSVASPTDEPAAEPAAPAPPAPTAPSDLGTTDETDADLPAPNDAETQSATLADPSETDADTTSGNTSGNTSLTAAADGDSASDATAMDAPAASGTAALAMNGLIAPLAVVPGQITSTGPLTNIVISSDLNCAVNHVSDTDDEFYGGTACGTFVANGEGALYGPAYVPAGGNATGAPGYVALTPIDQTGTGVGTSVDPYKVTTVADAGTLRITQTDSYIVGQESYRTDTMITNNGTTTVTVVLYKAGDCYLQNSDYGYGAYDPATGAVTCVGAADGGGPGQRIEQFYPLSPGGSYIQSSYSAVWAAIGTQQPFPNDCAFCDSNVDNGAGLSWTIVLAPGESATRAHLTTFSPLGVAPISTTKAADSPTTEAGGSNGYTVTFGNPNQTAITVTSIVDTLPVGFSYVPGSSSGATTADPTIVGNQLVWTGNFVVPAGGSLAMHFGVQVSSTPGTYFNSAGGSADDVAVAGVDNAAGVTVTGTTPPVDPSIDPPVVDPPVVDPPAVDPPVDTPPTGEPVAVIEPVAVTAPVDAVSTDRVTKAAPTYRGATLAYTGADVLPLVELGGLMLALGFALVGVGRRRTGR